MMLDVFPEQFRGHVDAAEQLEPGRRPGIHPALQKGNVRVTRRRHQFGRARRNPLAPVAKHDPRVEARHEAADLQLEPAQRNVHREQDMPGAEEPLFPHVDQRVFEPVVQHLAQGARVRGNRHSLTHLQWQRIGADGRVGSARPG